MAALVGTSLEGVALAPDKAVSRADIGLDKIKLYNAVLAEFVEKIEEIVGETEADGYINAVAADISSWINALYHDALGAEAFSVERVAHILTDLKNRVGASYTVRSVSHDTIVVAHAPCLFGAAACGRPALGALASAIFGRFAAENTGYARVEHAIACSDGTCRCEVSIHFRPTDAPRPDQREYYRVDEREFG